MKVFYHSADLDGYCAGAIVRKAYPDAEMIGIDYGDPFPWERIAQGEQVVMVDFSLQPFADMVRLADLADLVWIDHHQTAIEAEEAADGFVCNGFRIIGRAGCELAWEYFFPDERMPYAVTMLGRYDVWDHTFPQVLPFQYGCRMERTDPADPETIELWDRLLNGDVAMAAHILDRGAVILEYIAADNRKYAQACAFETDIDGLRCIAINRMLTNSQLFESVWNPARHDAMLAFGFRGGRWHVSLYTTKPDVDVSAVASRHGGGGHRGAAGFTCDVLPFRPDRPPEAEAIMAVDLPPYGAAAASLITLDFIRVPGR